MDGIELKPVVLESEKCNGCVSCMKRCPTEAIRVRNGKATIMYDRCVGCGECIKVCPTQAKKETFDPFSIIEQFKYKIALPSPSIYGQFKNLTDIDYILTGLKEIGFDDVFEVGIGAEIISEATRQYLNSPDTIKPVISSACPAVTNLILMRYEHLADHLSPLMLPEEVAAKLARKAAIEKTGLKESDIGIFIITQCAATVLELNRFNTDVVDGVLSFKEIYFPLLAKMNKIKSVEKLSKVSRLGVSWGSSAGEAAGLKTDNYLSADGVENIMTVLDDLEHEKLNNIEFLELNACTSGCVGGSMCIENPFLARMRLRQLRNKMEQPSEYRLDWKGLTRSSPYVTQNIFKLDENRGEAMKKMMMVKQIYSALPQLDCGACGAPCCMALAEDIVKGLDVSCVYRKGKDNKIVSGVKNEN